MAQTVFLVKGECSEEVECYVDSFLEKEHRPEYGWWRILEDPKRLKGKILEDARRMVQTLEAEMTEKENILQQTNINKRNHTNYRSMDEIARYRMDCFFEAAPIYNIETKDYKIPKEPTDYWSVRVDIDW